MFVKRSREFAAVSIMTGFTVLANAQTGGDPLVGTAQKIVTWLTGPLAIAITTIALVIGGLTIMFGQHEGWNRLGRVIIGAAVILGAAQLVTWLFGS